MSRSTYKLICRIGNFPVSVPQYTRAVSEEHALCNFRRKIADDLVASGLVREPKDLKAFGLFDRSVFDVARA